MNFPRKLLAARLGFAMRRPRLMAHTIRSMGKDSNPFDFRNLSVSLVTVGLLTVGISIANHRPCPTMLDASSISKDTTFRKEDEEEEEEEETTNVINWSGTHSVTVSNKFYWEPETVEEVENIIKECHAKGQPVRPLGASLSPNGIAFHPGGMISMANLDQVLEIDTERKTITVQAGISVNKVSAIEK